MKTVKTYCVTPYKQDVGGSNPSSPTQFHKRFQEIF